MANKKLVVIGGGAAGFFCAVNAARQSPALQVTIVEKTSKLLAKVRISGGSRCNVTHALFDIVEMSKHYPRGQNFVRKAFHQFFTTDTIEWFKKRGVQLKAEKDGRMFPVTDSSQAIIDCLMQEANKYAVEIWMNTEVKAINKTDGAWEIKTANGQQITANFICLATGGYPKSTMFDWLKNTGHTFSTPVPSLFTCNIPGHAITALMGVSVEQVRIKVAGTKLVEEGSLLITHWGFSGPAVLRLSAWGARELQAKNYHYTLHINWLPAYNEQTLKSYFTSLRSTHPTKKTGNHSVENLPNRLWLFLLGASGIDANLRFTDLPAKAENLLIKNLVDYTADVKGKTTFKEEFVTAGGIALNEVDANTMMSKKAEGLFFAGEVLDVDGITGGFNFQHAWTSGWIAAKNISLMSSG